VRHCERCFSLSEEPLCPVCSDPSRDRSRLLVVEDPTTVWAVEATGEFRGEYHVLLGRLSPLHGVGPEDLTIEALLERVRGGGVEEIILATDPTVEGETTALYIARQLEGDQVAISRPASGDPGGRRTGGGGSPDARPGAQPAAPHVTDFRTLAGRWPTNPV
jgi:recombination protein RecR